MGPDGAPAAMAWGKAGVSIAAVRIILKCNQSVTHCAGSGSRRSGSMRQGRRVDSAVEISYLYCDHCL